MMQRIAGTPARFLHGLHPLTKVILGCGIGIYALFLKNPHALAILLFFVVGVVASLRPRLSLPRVVALLSVLLAFAAANFLVAQDPAHAVTYTLRLVVFLLAIPLFSLTTSASDLAAFLSRLPVPPGVMVSLLLMWRFFPTLAEEVRRLRLFVHLWGKSWPLTKRIYRGLVVPLVFYVFDYSERLTLALELRGFSPGLARSCRQFPAFRLRDGLMLTAVVCLMGLCGVLEWARR
ncbi:MAG: energy-coupling factor transporter transmembrane component T [Desulfosoma sp.]